MSIMKKIRQPLWIDRSADTLAIGAPTRDAVHVFDWTPKGWERRAYLRSPDARGFDLALSSEGDTLTMSHHPPAGPDLVHVYQRDETDTWMHR
jgi:hypothetical protein